jgi:hypothetical protein
MEADMHMLLQGAVLLAALGTAVCLTLVIESGRMMRVRKDPFIFATHRVRLWDFLCSIIVLIVFVILLGRIAVPAHTRIPQPLIEIHLACDLGVLATGTLIAFRFSGARMPDTHRYWVYCGFMPFYVGMLITGIMLTVAR